MKTFSIESFERSGICRTVYTTRENLQWGRCDEASFPSYEELGRDLGITPADMIRIDQKHTDHVKLVTRADAGGNVIRPDEDGPCDGMVTNVPGLLLCTVEADCVPVYLLDPVKKAVGMVHSGWKGTAMEIAAAAVRLMSETFGCDPADVLAATGPCICPECYEVSPELKENFAPRYSQEELARIFLPRNGSLYLADLAPEAAAQKVRLDLPLAIRISLERAGLKPEHIEHCGRCTLHEGVFASYRGTGSRTERMLTAIMLK